MSGASHLDTIQHAANATLPAPEGHLEGLFWTIGRRRSMGLSRLLPDPVDEGILQTMVEAANWGQSNDDTEPWRFAVFTGDGREKLAEIFQSAETIDADGSPQAEKLDGLRKRAFAAPVWIAIGMTPKLGEDGTPEMDIHEEMMAVATAVQNLHLAAAAFGLFGMWHSKGISVNPEVGNQLGWESPSQLLGFFFCGWPNVDWPSGSREPIESKVQWHR